jgi:Carboxylesterase family
MSLMACWAWNVPIPYPKVTIPGMGQVEGSKIFDSTIKNRTIYSYRGIPFGKAPVGELRFLVSLVFIQGGTNN